MTDTVEVAGKVYTPSEFLDVPVELLRFMQGSLRGVDRENTQFAELAASVKEKGVLEPIIVRRTRDLNTNTDTYQIVNGTQRSTAAMDAGFTHVPARVVEMTDAEVMLAQVVTNSVHVDTKKHEYAKLLRSYLDLDTTLTVPALAAMLTKSVEWLNGILSLVKLSPKCGQAVDEGKINGKNAISLATLPTEVQDEYLARAISTPTDEFATEVKQRRDAIRKAKLGSGEAAPVFTPKAHLRALSELIGAVDDAGILGRVAEEANATTPVDAMRAILNWALNMDPTTLEQKRQKWEADQAEANARKEKSAKERAERKAFTDTKKAERSNLTLQLTNDGKSKADIEVALKAFDEAADAEFKVKFPAN